MTIDPYQREQWHGWISDFTESARFATLGPSIKEFSSPVLVTFLEGIAGRTRGELYELDEATLRATLLDDLAPLAIPGSAQGEVLLLLRLFLEELGEQGRLPDGAQHGVYVAALRSAYEHAVSGPGTITNPAAKLGRNDPCPCGSGRKYKKCCQRLLD
ncbi:MAG: SEC-C metal-binding domain-containing protein [Planctomycetota bacterium]